ncbi:hypothetical protein niasHT_022232 [Heterodera trifolii]|uniref:Uncharacterized protein n=1 Tax=Heterodera trifolii TaxID=157864 RepID=A0ABD2KPD7_9BILA
MTTRPSAAIDDNESYLDEQGLRWQRLFAVPDNDLSTLLRICIEFGGGTAQNWSNGNKCIIFGCAFAQQKNADALCSFRLIYVPERRTIYGQIEHKHTHLFAEAINNTMNDSDKEEKEEREEEQQRKIREKEVEEYGQKQSEVEKEAEEEVIGDGQGEMGAQREEGREKAIREDQPNGGEKEAKEEVMGDGQRKMGEQREEGREKAIREDQPNGAEKEAKEEVMGDGQQQSGEEAEKERELRKIAAEKGTITANEQRQLTSNQIVIENAIASSSNAAHSFTDHLDKSWHWLANVREEDELKQLCTQKCLKFPDDFEWDKLFFSHSDAIVRLRCNFWQRHRKMCGVGGGPSAVVYPPCNYYARAKTSANEWPTSSDGIRDWLAEQIYVGTNLKIFGDDEHEDDHQWPQNEQFRMSYRYLCAAMDSLQSPKRR